MEKKLGKGGSESDSREPKVVNAGQGLEGRSNTELIDFSHEAAPPDALKRRVRGGWTNKKVARMDAVKNIPHSAL